MNTIAMSHRITRGIDVVHVWFKEAGVTVRELDFEPEDMPKMGNIVSNFLFFNIIPD
jgi:hypothetical protein